MPASDPNYPSAQAIWLKEKIPGPLLIISIIALPLILYGTIGGLYVGRYDVAAYIGLVMGGLWFFLYTYNKGSKLAWDEDRIYIRHGGWSFRRRFPWIGNVPWRSLAYDQIARMDDLTLNDPGAKSFLLPFQLFAACL